MIYSTSSTTNTLIEGQPHWCKHHQRYCRYSTETGICKSNVICMSGFPLYSNGVWTSSTTNL